MANNGRFYFKRTSNGNLIGEFSNNTDNGIYTESSDLQGNSTDFIGKYKSTWNDGPKAILADLEITKPNKLFHLVWVVKGTKEFDGTGMLCDDILVGDYHSV